MSLSTGATVWTSDRRRLQLGPLLKSGGAGSVYPLVESPAQVAKIYHDSVDHTQSERKVAAMLELSPRLPDLIEESRRYVQIAWPQALLRDDHGRFVGFLMPVIDVKSTSELECILQERQARANKLPNGLGAKVTLAANLAAVITELHKQGHHVVDLKPVNVRFYPLALYMAMLDCDGFSIQGRGERFLAQQITPDYLAPEFQNRPILPELEEQQDRFALAVVIFQLLNFGIHPFTGRPTGDHVPTDIPGRIAKRCYAYGSQANVNLSPSPVSGHLAMPAEVRQLFDRAFTGDAARPAAAEWAALLKSYAQRSNQRLSPCSRDRQHQHFSGLPCAACARVALIANTARDSAAAKAALSSLAPKPSTARTAAVKNVRGTRVALPGPSQQTAQNAAPPLIPGLPASVQLPPALMAMLTQQRKLAATPILSLVAGIRFSSLWPLWIIPFLLLLLIVFTTFAPEPEIAMVTPFRHPPPKLMRAATPPPVARKSYQPMASLDSVKGAIQMVVDAMLLSDPPSEASAIAYLRGNAAGYPPAPPSQFRDDFTNFAGNLATDNDSKAESLRTVLANEYSRERRNSEVAYDLGWLALYRRDPVAANNWFARSIGDDPGRVQAWCGYAIAAGSDNDTVSAMAVAESLQPGFLATAMNGSFPPELLRHAAIDPAHIMEQAEKARALYSALANVALSPSRR